MLITLISVNRSNFTFVFFEAHANPGAISNREESSSYILRHISMYHNVTVVSYVNSISYKMKRHIYLQNWIYLIILETMNSESTSSQFF